MIAVDKENSQEEMLLPLKDVFIASKIAGALATIDVSLDYVNPLQEKALEAVYEFPLDKNMLMGKLKAEIDGREVEAQVRDKEKA